MSRLWNIISMFLLFSINLIKRFLLEEMSINFEMCDNFSKHLNMCISRCVVLYKSVARFNKTVRLFC